MKVKIGPFPNRWTTSNLEHWFIEKRYNVDYYWEIDDWPRDKLDERTEKILDWWQDVLNATVNKYYFDRKERKIDVRIDPYDTWNVDDTIAQIALPLLKQLQETKQGSPFVDDEDVPEELRSTSAPPKENEWDTDELLHKRWDWVLAEIIWAFEQKVKDDWQGQFYSGEMDTLWIPLDEDENEIGEGKRLMDPVDPEIKAKVKMWRMDKGPNDTSVFDKEGHDAFQARITNGFRLFGKYYEGLWD